MTFRQMLAGIVFLWPMTLAANQAAHGWCEQGAQAVVTAGQTSVTQVQASYPQCTVTVYFTGTLTLATLFSDNFNTPMGNPFTANAFGFWRFYAANGRYDVRLSGGGLPAPWTIGDIQLADPGGATNPFPAGLQTQYLEIQPNTGNNATVNFASFPYANATSYNFPPQSPGGSLTPGLNAVTLTPVPLGVNGSDVNHRLYVSGGTGTPEACLLAGGGAISGQPTGGIILNCANSHTGAWSLGSASSGLAEAIQQVSSSGGGQVVAAGRFTLHSILAIPSNVQVIGMGRGNTVLQVAAGEFANDSRWMFGAAEYAAITAAVPATKIKLANLTLDMNQAGNPVNWVQAWGIATLGMSNSLISNVEIINIPVINQTTCPLCVFISLGLMANSNDNVVENSAVRGTVCSVQGPTLGFGASGSHNRFTNNYADNLCGTAFGAGPHPGTPVDGASRGNIFNGNVFDLAASVQVATSQAYSADSADGTAFTDNVCIGNGTGPACYGPTADAPNISSTGVTFTNNYAFNCGYGYLVLGVNSTQQIRYLTVQGGQVSGCTSGGVYIADWARNVVIQGVQIRGNAPAGVDIKSLAAGSISNISIFNNIVVDNIGPGILISDVPGVAQGSFITIAENQATDDRAPGSKTQTYGFSMLATVIPSAIKVYGNSFVGNLTGSTNVVGGVDSLVKNGFGFWGFNTEDATDAVAYQIVTPSAFSNVMGSISLVNGLNSNINAGSNGGMIVFGPTSGYSLGGFQFPLDGRVLEVYNATNQAMTVVNQDASTPASNRIICPTGADVVLAARPSWAIFRYSAELNGWVLKTTY